MLSAFIYAKKKVESNFSAMYSRLAALLRAVIGEGSPSLRANRIKNELSQIAGIHRESRSFMGCHSELRKTDGFGVNVIRSFRQFVEDAKVSRCTPTGN